MGRAASLEWLERRLGQAALLSFRRPRIALLTALVLAVSAWFGAQRLKVDPDLANLLPDSFQSVRDLEALLEQAGSIGYVVVVLEGEKPEQLREVAEELAPKLEELPRVRYVDFRRPIEWFKSRALYFAETETLEEANQRLVARQRWETRKRNPMYLDLEGGEPPALEFDDLLAQQEASAPRWLQGDGTGTAQSAYYEDLERGMLVLLARPVGRSTDMEFTNRVVADVESLVTEFAPQHPDVKLSLTGRFKKKIDQAAQISSDLALTSALGLALVLLYLSFHFRRLFAVVALATPLLLGLLLAFGAVGYFYGTLNLLSAFAGVILLGLGIDHGVHLLAAYDARRAQGFSASAAVEKTFGATGRAVLVAALTTVAGFLGVALSEFRAFKEFGVVAALGMSSVVLAYLFGLPALLSLQANFKPSVEQSTPLRRWLKKAPQWVGVSSLALMLLAVAPVYRLSFDYDFAALEDSELPSFKLDAIVNEVLGYSQTPALILTESPEQERAVSAELRRIRDAQPDPTIDLVASLSDLVPEQQSEKQPIIASIRKTVSRVKPQWLSEEDQQHRQTALDLTTAKPFARSELPKAITRQFSSSEDGVMDSGLVLVFPAIALSDGERVPAFAGDIRSAASGNPVAGESLLLADILEMIQREGPTVLALTIAAVAVTLGLLVGSLSQTLLVLGAATLTIGATLGLAAALGVDLNYLNVIVIPVLFGIAVDGAVHLLVSRKEGRRAVSDTARAVSGALLTTGLGFAVLTLADHPGLQSVGQLAVLGLVVNAVISVVMIPSWLFARTEEVHSQEVLT